jgi:hypothetical protein
VKAAGEKYLPRLEAQTDEEDDAYRARASLFNATARTADGYLGLIFRRPPFVKAPGDGRPEDRRRKTEDGPGEEVRGRRSEVSAIGKAMEGFVNDADMQGTSLANYAKNVVKEVVAVGRAGTLMDWEGESENRVYASLYAAEKIINWRVERISGRNVLSLVVLKEAVEVPETGDGSAGASPYQDGFEVRNVEQLRVLRLEEARDQRSEVRGQREGEYRCVVEVWRKKEDERVRGQKRVGDGGSAGAGAAGEGAAVDPVCVSRSAPRTVGRGQVAVG